MQDYSFLLNTASGNKWRRTGISRRAGAMVPLFSVYSRQSLGIGDLADLKLLIDWAAASGNSILQLLPMNEMPAISCPYDSLSGFALEPAYLALRCLPGYSSRMITELSAEFPAGRQYVDYRLKKAKLKVAREILEKKPKLLSDPGLAAFREENSYWLDDFLLFKALKDYHAGAGWYEWEERFKERHPEELKNFADNYRQELDLQAWLQWQLFLQFKEAKEYAASAGVFLKGDLPVLVSRDSADVWAHREFFKLGFASGAPPDMYCAKGQRWGMPTYNWQAIASDGYRYIKEKLKYAGNFYDIVRVDHAVGLFRIWSIPYNEPQENQGLNGSFDPQDERLWGRQGKDILSAMLDAAAMLLCAEDLGVIPQVCTQALYELGIPGNDVQRWAKDWHTRHDFLPPQEYRAAAVAMLSTHDTTNWPGWWEKEAGTIDEQLFIRKCGQHRIDYLNIKDKLFDPSRSVYGRLRWRDDLDSPDKFLWQLGRPKEELADLLDLYLNSFCEKEKLWNLLGLPGQMREKYDHQLLESALRLVLDSRAIFCVQNILDYLFLGEDTLPGDPYSYRFNIPGRISEKNWSLVLPFSLEELLADPVTARIKEMIRFSGRINNKVLSA